MFIRINEKYTKLQGDKSLENVFLYFTTITDSIIWSA